jgi:hypothetical protein
MLENVSAFSIVAFILSFVLGILCFVYIFKTLINKKIMIKVMEDSLGDAVNDKSIIAMVTILLGVLGISFFSVCIAIYLFAFAS